MQELSDGDLLYMIHFDRNNWTRKWIEKAEKEAQRRRLSLHVINDDYRASSINKTIETQIDLPYSEPRSWQVKLFPWITGGIVSLIYRMIYEWRFDLYLIILLFGLLVFDFYLWRHSKGSNNPKEIFSGTIS